MGAGQTIAVPLQHGKVALVDAEDAERILQHKWSFYRGRNTCYAQCFSKEARGQLLHRFILNPPDYLQVDHINHDGLDNRRSNLRLVTSSQNQANARTCIRNSSGFKGVFRHRSRWQAQIGVNGQRIHIGTFDTPEEAASAYDLAARQLFGEFAHLNLASGKQP